MRVTLVRLEAGWLALCVVGWLIVSSTVAEREEECRARGDFLCFSTGEVFYIVGLVALGTLVLGAVAIALVWAVARRLRRP